MFEGITNSLESSLPTVSTFLLTGAVLYAGRKVAPALCYKGASAVAGLTDPKYAAQLNKKANKCFASAQKHAARDVAVVLGLAATGFAAGKLHENIENRRSQQNWNTAMYVSGLTVAGAAAYFRHSLYGAGARVLTKANNTIGCGKYSKFAKDQIQGFAKVLYKCGGEMYNGGG